MVSCQCPWRGAEVSSCSYTASHVKDFFCLWQLRENSISVLHACGRLQTVLLNSHGLLELTHWGRDKIAAFSQTTHSNAFSWMKILEFRLKFHWSLFLRVLLTIFQHWFRWWLGADKATSHYQNQWWLDQRRIYVSLGLNELSPPCRFIYF